MSQIRTEEEILFGKQANFWPKPSPYISVPTCAVACCAYLPNKNNKKTWRGDIFSKRYVQCSMCRETIVIHPPIKVLKEIEVFYVLTNYIFLLWPCISLGAQNKSQAWVQSLKVSWGDVHYKTITLKQSFCLWYTLYYVKVDIQK